MIDDLTFSRTVLAQGLLSFGDLRQLERLARERGISRYEASLQTKMIPEARLMQVVAELYGMPLVRMHQVDVDMDWARRLTVAQMQGLGVLVLGPGDDGVVRLAMVNPHDVDALEMVGGILDCALSPVLVDARDLEAALERIFLLRTPARITRPTSQADAGFDSTFDQEIPTGDIPMPRESAGAGAHETSPTGNPIVSDFDQGGAMERALAAPDLSGLLAHAPPDALLRATARLLVERRIFSLEDLRRVLSNEDP